MTPYKLKEIGATAIALLLLGCACLALGQSKIERLMLSTTNATRYIASRQALYELVPVDVPLPTGTQRAVSWKRMVGVTMTYTNRPLTLTITGTPPFTVEFSTNFVSWEYFADSTNSVYAIEVCAQQQVDIPFGFFRTKPMPQLMRLMRGIR